ncbi:SDR family NAD(P)-dependent oxidoreductase [Mycobacterium hodleri]|uniref:SDR family NAD(P)-dependent oxidoreductase n=1 Tax=Mycolicibacterium hodleri TaxID=49897 RepID=A0A544W7Q8_9MYCO|nr:SDR family NAD(P)-dependent oxidoreductase [Mycolicibacterium hodleri]TQR88271.1 SDR family NAD(P)-dependent oxidoreductase [Mycolicibacterium hodleri]
MTSQWSPTRLGNLTGKRVVVTGATNGVGLATAGALARAGAHVILAVRNVELGAQRAAEIGGDTSVVKLDLADQSSVRAFPNLFDGDVDVLVNNAGLVAQNRSETVDGFEMTLGTNFLGPFALTNLLFPRVRSLIVNVASDAHKSAKIDLDDPHLRTTKWSAFPAYGRSKLAMMLWGLELDRRLRAAGSPVTSQLTHPGWVASNLSNVSDKRVMSAFHTVVKTAAHVLANDTDAGAAPTLYCISEPIPPGSYVGIDSRLGLKGAPTLSGRSAGACDYDVAAQVVAFAEKETGTTIPV